MQLLRSPGPAMSFATLTVLFGLSLVHAQPPKGDSKMTVASGKQVSFEYTLQLEDKKVLESNVGKEPLTYTHGSNEIIPGLEKALEGMTVGETKHVTVKPEEGYGTVDPKSIQEVKKSVIPQEAQKVGAQLQGTAPDGQAVYPRVKEIKADTVVLDFNHPLAGKTLFFDVKVLDVRAPSAAK